MLKRIIGYSILSLVGLVIFVPFIYFTKWIGVGILVVAGILTYFIQLGLDLIDY